MSGRATVVAGTDATAAFMNTYVMDGIFYKQQAGSSVVTMTSASPWSTGSLNVTNLSGFTQNPLIVATVQSAAAGQYAVHVNVTSTTAFTIYCNYYGASASSRTVQWLAVQATSSTSAGS